MGICRRLLLLCLTACAALTACQRSTVPATGVNAASPVVRDGHTRFTVLTPTLIRVEYADDDRFEDGLTQTVVNRSFAPVAYSSAVEDGMRVIRTTAMTLRYRQTSGEFTPQNLSVTVNTGAIATTGQPDWAADSNPENLGGWRRALDNEQGPQPLHNGLLSRQGWFLLNDSQTVLMTPGASDYQARPAHDGSYQDGYLFGYGHDYAQGLADLRALTGPAPLLPRKAFGVWFSRYWAYSDADLRELVAQFRAHQVPLDTLSIDTDWKRVHNAAGCAAFSVIAGAQPGAPCSWNGWDWNRALFPDPAGFVAWAHDQGLALALNVHPSIDSTDPAFAQTQTQSGGLALDGATPPCALYQADPLGLCYVFDWTQPKQLKAYFSLHAPMEAQGIDFWWLDWCCDGASATAAGLTGDTWINSQYARDNARRERRWPAFSRIGASFQQGDAGVGNNGAGAFAEHRYTMHFTGDTCATWQMLAFEAQFTASEGNIGLPYVTHDIGSFLGPPQATTGCNGTLGHTAHLPDDFYVRWVQFGTFQPLDRLHSNHGDRLPWEYPGVAETAASDFLRLRERLVPFLYTLSRQAYDSGLPMTRALYLQWPELDEAYKHPTEYTLGADMLIATVAAAGNPATVAVWIPPGEWTDYFTGETFTGPQTVTRSVSYEQYPVFLRSGAILPTQLDLPTSSAGPQDNLVLTVWPGAGANNRLDLYEDQGQGFGYRDNAYGFTPLHLSATADCATLTIGARQGQFPGALAQRSWTLNFVGVPATATATVRIGGRIVAASAWNYNAATRTLTINTGTVTTAAAVSVSAGGSGCGA
jgi:alpha-glucosidase (family GH31 glycosyl hydrolase)